MRLIDADDLIYRFRLHEILKPLIERILSEAPTVYIWHEDGHPEHEKTVMLAISDTTGDPYLCFASYDLKMGFWKDVEGQPLSIPSDLISWCELPPFYKSQLRRKSRRSVTNYYHPAEERTSA